jgi:hypothetical protein
MQTGRASGLVVFVGRILERDKVQNMHDPLFVNILTRLARTIARYLPPIVFNGCRRAVADCARRAALEKSGKDLELVTKEYYNSDRRVHQFTSGCLVDRFSTKVALPNPA